MLLVVCPNLGLDRILSVPRFAPSRVQRSTDVVVQSGGKGSNVARVFRQLGGEVVLTGLVGRRNRDSVCAPLAALGVQMDPVEGFDGDSRHCTIILDPATPAHPTVINEESAVIEAGSEQRLLDTVAAWLPRVEAVLVTGSLARGMSDNFYFKIVEQARTLGVLSMIDALGQPLIQGLKALPDIVKVNEDEFSSLGRGSIGRPLSARNLAPLALLAPTSILTLGAEGAVLSDSFGVQYGCPPQLSAVNPIGCGDSFAAGYLLEYLKSRISSRALSLGLAAAADDASTRCGGDVDPQRVATLAETVVLQSI